MPFLSLHAGFITCLKQSCCGGRNAVPEKPARRVAVRSRLTPHLWAKTQSRIENLGRFVIAREAARSYHVQITMGTGDNAVNLDVLAYSHRLN